MTSHDPAVAELVQASLEDSREVLRRALVAGQRSGAIRTDESPAALADFVLATMQGLRVLSKADATRRRSIRSSTSRSGRCSRGRHELRR